MNELLDLFTGDETMEDLCAEAIENNKTGFIQFVLSNDLQDFSGWSDYLCENIDVEMYDLLLDTCEDELYIDELAKFGNLEVLEHIYEETEELPSLEGYNSAKKNGHDDVVEWLNDMAVDKLYE